MYPDQCIHYNGGLNDKCRKGHVYLEMATPLTEEDIKWPDVSWMDSPWPRSKFYGWTVDRRNTA